MLIKVHKDAAFAENPMDREDVKEKMENLSKQIGMFGKRFNKIKSNPSDSE